MNDTPNPLTLPIQTPRRSRSLNIRLTESERSAVEHLAQQQGLSASALARHFLLQAVAYYHKKMRVEGAADEQSDW